VTPDPHGKDLPPGSREPVDLVVPLAPRSAWGEHGELRILLRSAERHVQGLRRLYVIGSKPTWLAGEAIHVPLADALRNKGDNIIAKILVACDAPGISAPFIRCSDDFVFLKDVGRGSLPHLRGADLTRMPARARSRPGPYRHWNRILWKTMSYCREQSGLSAIYHYDTHSPQPIDPASFRRTMSKVPVSGRLDWAVNTLYFNLSGQGRVEYGDRPAVPRSAFKVAFEKESSRDYDRDAENCWFLGYNDAGLTPRLKEWLLHRFPDACRWEAPGSGAALPTSALGGET